MLDYSDEIPPIPPFATAGEALQAAMPALEPPSRTQVDQVVEEVRRVNAGGYWIDWENSVAPYMQEPMRAITSRHFASLAFAGPARSVKTAALIEGAVAHAIASNPRMTHIVQMSQAAAREYSIERIDPMIRNSPKLNAKRSTGRGSNNVYDKKFRGGMRLTIGWPVVQQLSSRDIALVLLTDYDRFPEDLGGEGSAFALARKRPQTFGTLGKVVAESSPGFPILDESWKAKTPHEAPPCTGILSLFNMGTRGRLYWKCPDCSERFEPRFERLDWPKEFSTPAEAGKAATMICPECGSVIEHRHKSELNAGAIWLHEHRNGTELVEFGDPAIRETDIASWWLHGPPAAFAPWSQLVTRLLQAEQKLEETGEETDLVTVVNTDLGMPHLPRSRSSEGQITVEGLKEIAGDRLLGVAPKGTRFLTVQADVQGSKFVIQVDAWGQDLERWMIDRFDLHTPPETAPNHDRRSIDPAKYAEDWEALTPLLYRTWPVEGTDYQMRPVSLTCDMQGAAGVTDKAYDWYRARRKGRENQNCYLVRGRDGLKRAQRAELVYQKSGAGTDIPVLYAATDMLKDELSNSLRRDLNGARAYHLTSNLPSEIFSELAAERRGVKGWEKRPGMSRNEAMDLSVYGLATVIVLKGEAIDWDRPPAWAAPLERNPFASLVDADGSKPALKKAPKKRRRKMSLKQ